MPALRMTRRWEPSVLWLNKIYKLGITIAVLRMSKNDWVMVCLSWEMAIFQIVGNTVRASFAIVKPQFGHLRRERDKVNDGSTFCDCLFPGFI
jgi:hypothetical protein